MNRILAQIGRSAATILIVILALLVAVWLWRHYERSPWTRDGRVRADVVRVTPDIGGLVTEVDVRDNQPVQAGQLLFVIDKPRYSLAVAQAQANIASAGESTMEKLRVIQWNTGKVGKHTMRAVLDDPRLELVGVFAHSPEKVGKDAGALCGRPDTGILATDNIDDLVALNADTVFYTPFNADLSHAIRLLENGMDVISTNLFLNVGGIQGEVGLDGRRGLSQAGAVRREVGEQGEQRRAEVRCVVRVRVVQEGDRGLDGGEDRRRGVRDVHAGEA